MQTKAKRSKTSRISKYKEGVSAPEKRAWRYRLQLKTAGIILLIAIAICSLDGIYPFGDNCILHVDMYHQYCPFFTEFRRKLVSGDSLMYSWNIGLGSDFISVFVYYLSSPLNWLLVLCPEKFIIEFMTLTILLKMALAGAFFCHLLLKRYSAEEEWPVIVFSVAYAFSGFMVAYNWDIMWLDSVALAPLVLLGLYRLVKEGRCGLYYGALALAILCNYYISIMICIYVVFDFAYLWLTTETVQRRGKTFARFVWYSLLAGGTGCVLILPEYIILSYSGSGGIKFPEKLEWYYNLLAQGARMAVTGSVYTGNNHWPNLYSGAFAILLFFCFFVNSRIAKREKAAYGIFAAFLYISFDLNVLDWFWHGLHYPDSLPGRQSFLFTLLLLVMSYRAYREREAMSVRQILAAAAAALVLVGIGIYFCPGEITERSAGILTCLLIILYAMSLLWDSIPAILEESCSKTNMRRIAFGIRRGVLVLALGELAVNMAVCGFSSTSRSKYLLKTDPYRQLLAIAEEDAAEEEEHLGEKVFYRVENTERKCKNEDCLYGYPSITQFSSLMNVNVSHFFQSIYMEGGKNFYCHNGATPVSSAMFAVRYMISDNPYEETAYRSLIGEADGNYLYRNEGLSSLGFVLPEERVNEWEEFNGKKLEGVNCLAGILGADEELLIPYACRMEASEGETTIHIPAEGYYFAACTQKPKADTLTFVYESGKEITWSKTTHTYLFDLGACDDEEAVSIKNSAKEKIEFSLYRMNDRACEMALGTLRETPLHLSEVTSMSVKGRASLAEPGRLILTIPAEEGWMLQVDGEEMPYTAFGEAFISVSLPAGEHEICLSYETPGLKAAALVSVLCMALAILSLGLGKYLASSKRIQ